MATAVSIDKLGRRPLIIYPYSVTCVSALCLGIMGYFDYTKPSTSSLLVSLSHEWNIPFVTTNLSDLDIFRLFGNFFDYLCIGYWLRLRC